MRLSLLFASVGLLGAGVAQAEEARPRSIWLECKTPAVWPLRAGSAVRLSCRVDQVTAGPAFWQTVDPFRPDRMPDLVDPFVAEGVPVYLDLFDRNRPARRRPPRLVRTQPPAEALSDELMSPFEAIPDTVDLTDTINPFQPREDSPQPPPRSSVQGERAE
jgi:hypothetical protein